MLKAHNCFTTIKQDVMTILRGTEIYKAALFIAREEKQQRIMSQSTVGKNTGSMEDI